MFLLQVQQAFQIWNARHWIDASLQLYRTFNSDLFSPDGADKHV